MQLPLSSNAYGDVTDFKICGFHKNTKSSISREQNIIFLQIKKFIKGLLYDKEKFCSGGNL